MSYVSDTMSYVHVRHHTYIPCRTYDVIRLYPVYRTYDIARTIYHTMSSRCVARTMSYVMHVLHRTYVRHRRWQESRWTGRHDMSEFELGKEDKMILITQCFSRSLCQCLHPPKRTGTDTTEVKTRPQTLHGAELVLRFRKG